MQKGTASIRLGTCAIPLRKLEITENLGSDATAEVLVHTADLVGNPSELASEAAIHISEREDQAERVFAGWVTSLSLQDDEAVIRVRSGPALDEVRFDRFISGPGMPAPELVWSISRMAGYPPELLQIQGLIRTPDEILVAMPIRGLSLNASLDIGPVRLEVERDAIAQFLAPIPDEPATSAFLQAQSWAIATTKADLLFDGEQEGIALITGWLDRLALEAQYSTAADPSGAVLPFDRSSLFVDPTAEPIVFARGASTGRSWLRTLNLIPTTPGAETRRVDLDPPDIGTDPRFDEALHFWREACHASDDVQLAVALWSAIEFLTATISVPPLFAQSDLDRFLSTAADFCSSEEQRERLTQVIGRANEPPQMVRLSHALTAADVPSSPEELTTLRRVRHYRNAFLHGTTAEPPTRDEFDLCIAIVARMLAFRSKAV